MASFALPSFSDFATGVDSVTGVNNFSSGFAPFVPPETSLTMPNFTTPDTGLNTTATHTTGSSILDIIGTIGNLAIGGILASRIPANTIKQPTTVVTTPKGTSTVSPTLPGTVNIGGVTANKNLLYIGVLLLVIAGILWMSKKMG